jgi:hypothetical protein
MTYYGRWTYKYEVGAMKGAAGVLIVHETGPAGYPFEVVQAKTTEQFDLVTPDKNMGRVNIEGWITLDRAKELMRAAGRDFDTLKNQAGDPRLQAGAARRHGLNDDSQQVADDRFAECDRKSRGERSSAEGRVRGLYRRIGIILDLDRRSTAIGSTTAPQTTRSVWPDFWSSRGRLPA